jgi:hypothetical protein
MLISPLREFSLGTSSLDPQISPTSSKDRLRHPACQSDVPNTTFPTLLYQHHLLNLRKRPRLNAVEIDAAAQVFGVESYMMTSGRFYLIIHQRGDLLSNGIKHVNRYC